MAINLAVNGEKIVSSGGEKFSQAKDRIGVGSGTDYQLMKPAVSGRVVGLLIGRCHANSKSGAVRDSLAALGKIVTGNNITERVYTYDYFKKVNFIRPHCICY